MAISMTISISIAMTMINPITISMETAILMTEY
jgi:hypothetical protein